MNTKNKVHFSPISLQERKGTKSLLTALALLFCSLQAVAQPLPRVAPEQVGMDSHRLLHADEAIQKAILNKEIPGAVLAVVRHGKMAYLKAYGNRRIYPNIEPMEINTVFDMASCSKPMSTAVSAMILIERGQLRLLDRVNLYLPDFREWQGENGEKQDIRIVDLMTHTSGLPPYAPVAELQKEYSSPNPEGLMKYISTCKRDFKPQTNFQYSCLNYITLQHVIEVITGQNLRDFAKENIFNVLGMQHTDYLPTVQQKDGKWINTVDYPWMDLIAPTEKQKDGSVLCGQVHDPLARILNGGISGNAGVFSDANDIAVLAAALLNGGEYNGRRILSPLGVKTMRTVPREVAGLGRTPGWDVFSAYASNHGDLFGPNTFGHTGYTGTSILIDPDNDTAVILLINAVHPEDGHSVVRLRSLVANAVAASICPPAQVYTDHYYKRFLEFEADAPIGPKDIVMVGNSLTENGGDWSIRLNKKNIRNRGIIGDEAMGIYQRLFQILPGTPRKIFLMAGINDVSHNLSADSVVELVTLVIDKIRTGSPSTELYLQSLLPINESFGRYKTMTGKTDLIPEINSKLEALAKDRKIPFINLFPLFTEKGSNVMRKELTTDGLHLTEEGYKIWSKALRRVCRNSPQKAQSKF